MSDAEKKLLSMYSGTKLDENGLNETSTVNHLILSLLVLVLGGVFWLSVALINAENQRYAMERGMCQDRLFPRQVDLECLRHVKSREHWYQHWIYAVTHVLP